MGALLAEDVLGSTGLAGIPVALFTAGSAVAALVAGRLSQAYGRRVGLAAGYGAGALGSVGVVVGAVTEQTVVMLAAMTVYGSGTAANLQARYAGTDLAAPDARGRAVSTVLVATTVGAVAGPNLVSWTGDLALDAGMPALTGPFVLAAVAYGAAALVLAVLLRPDPLLVAREQAAVAADEPIPVDEPGRPVVVSGGLALAAAAMVSRSW